MSSIGPPYPSYRDVPPKLIGGARCLDFLNTVEWRGDPTAQGERLVDFDEFIVWAGHAGYAETRQQAAMRRLAQQSPSRARAALADAVALREAIAALVARRAGAAATFNDMLKRLHIAFELQDDGGELRQVPVDGGDVLRAPLAQIALDVTALVTSPGLAQVRHCGNDRCGWFFLDLSRNKSRRWCDMAACGNTAKARAHYERHRHEHR